MKILIYGAGVLGSLCAARLQSAGQEVWLLARGQRLEDLRQHGLVLENMVTDERSEMKVNVLETLGPDDAYDLIMVVVGKHQVPGVLPSLAANRCTPNILFVGNNAAGPDEYIRALTQERVLLGFLTAGGTTDGPVVRYAEGDESRKSTFTIGEVDGTITPRLEEIAEVLKSIGYNVVLCSNIDAWLKTHAALVAPLAGALTLAGGDNFSLARDRKNVRLAAKGIRESLHILQSKNIPLIPSAAKLYIRLPEFLLVFLMQWLLARKEVGYAFAHADKAKPEMALLIHELLTLGRGTNVSTPALARMRAGMGSTASQ
jgi:2-dehydropantoate 2-reductase